MQQENEAVQTEDEHRGVLLHVPERLVRIIGDWIEDEQGRWPVDTAYQSDLAYLQAQVRQELGEAEQ